MKVLLPQDVEGLGLGLAVTRGGTLARSAWLLSYCRCCVGVTLPPGEPGLRNGLCKVAGGRPYPSHRRPQACSGALPWGCLAASAAERPL